MTLQDVKSARNLVMSPLAWPSIYDSVLGGKYSLIEAYVLDEDLASGPML